MAGAGLQHRLHPPDLDRGARRAEGSRKPATRKRHASVSPRISNCRWRWTTSPLPALATHLPLRPPPAPRVAQCQLINRAASAWGVGLEVRRPLYVRPYETASLVFCT